MLLVLFFSQLSCFPGGNFIFIFIFFSGAVLQQAEKCQVMLSNTCPAPRLLGGVSFVFFFLKVLSFEVVMSHSDLGVSFAAFN